MNCMECVCSPWLCAIVWKIDEGSDFTISGNCRCQTWMDCKQLNTYGRRKNNKGGAGFQSLDSQHMPFMATKRHAFHMAWMGIWGSHLTLNNCSYRWLKSFPLTKRSQGMKGRDLSFCIFLVRRLLQIGPNLAVALLCLYRDYCLCHWHWRRSHFVSFDEHELNLLAQLQVFGDIGEECVWQVRHCSLLCPFQSCSSWHWNRG